MKELYYWDSKPYPFKVGNRVWIYKPHANVGLSKRYRTVGTALTD